MPWAMDRQSGTRTGAMGHKEPQTTVSPKNEGQGGIKKGNQIEKKKN